MAPRNKGFGSILSKALDEVGSYVAGDGNPAGSPNTRTLGYEPTQVAQAASDILMAPATPSVQSELLLMGAAGVALMLLMRR